MKSSRNLDVIRDIFPVLICLALVPKLCLLAIAKKQDEPQSSSSTKKRGNIKLNYLFFELPLEALKLNLDVTDTCSSF